MAAGNLDPVSSQVSSFSGLVYIWVLLVGAFPQDAHMGVWPQMLDTQKGRTDRPDIRKA